MERPPTDPDLPPALLLPKAHAGRDWHEALGEAWLARQETAGLTWRQAWRRAAWRVWERPQRGPLSLTVEPEAAARPAARELPPELAALEESLAGLRLSDGRRRLAVLARELDRPRGELRRDLTRLALLLTGGTFFARLKAQAARLLVRAAREGRSRAVLDEARALRRILTLVEPPEELRPTARALRELVRRCRDQRK